jgi:hypothetical protein
MKTNRTAVRRTTLLGAAFGAVFAVSCGLAFAQGTSLQSGTRYTAYTSSFAKRFALPEAEVTIPGDGPLYALEIVPISPNPARSLWCDAKLYIDPALPVKLPSSDQSWSREVTNRREHFFFTDDVGAARWQKLAIEDRRHFSRHQSSGNLLAAVATPGARPGSQGSFASAPYHAFLREIFFGVTYVHIEFPCRWIADFETKYPAMQIWLERVGGANYRDPSTGGMMQPKDFIQLDVPSELVRRMKAAITAK